MIRPGSKERALRVAILVAGDFLIAWGALVVVGLLRPDGTSFHADPLLVPLFSGGLVAALALAGFYHDRVTPRTRPSVVTAMVIQAAIVAFAAAGFGRPMPRVILFAAPLVEMLAIPVWRRLLRAIAPVRPRDTILVGDAHAIDEAMATLRMSGDRRIRVTGMMSATVEGFMDPAARGQLREVEEVVLLSPDADPGLRMELLRIRGPRGFLMLASHVEALLTSKTPGWLGDQPLVEVAVGCGYGASAAVKRSIDIVGAVLISIVTAPLWVVTAAAIWLEDRQPVFLRQTRVGRDGIYGMWKFRSMRSAAGEEPRLTRVGAFLRRYHVDELPQLINVLGGEMSLVGPRPERPELTAAILTHVPDFDLRSLVRPGIAGLAQVAADYESKPEVKLRYDLMYMCDWSVWLDIRLLFRALSSSLAGTGR